MYLLLPLLDDDGDGDGDNDESGADSIDTFGDDDRRRKQRTTRESSRSGIIKKRRFDLRKRGMMMIALFFSGKRSVWFVEALYYKNCELTSGTL